MHNKTARIFRRFNNHIKHCKHSYNKWYLYSLSHRHCSQPIEAHAQPPQFTPTPNNSNTNLIFPIVGVALGTMTIGAVMLKSYYTEHMSNIHDNEHTVMNYSGTHSATPRYYFQPKSISEVENMVLFCNKKKINFRPMGSGISPNGISYSNIGIMNMSQCNKILNIDTKNKQITVEAGVKLNDIIRAIKPYNMALENIPSITEQQIGGLIQVGAHGTGINIGPCDMQIVKMTIITPQFGKIELTQNDKLFYWARVGLGTIGVVTQVTIQCVDRHKLAEYLWIMDINELEMKRNELLDTYKHVKWLWVPYMNNKAVVIASEKIDDPHYEAIYNAKHKLNDIDLEVKCQQPMRELLCSKTGENISELNEYLSFADLRDLLLGYDNSKHVLDTNWVKEINGAEFKYWNNLSNKCQYNEPQQIDYTENVLSFECGGQQWVYEICFPIKKHYDSDEIPMDIQFAKDLLAKIKEYGIAAPAPLEQRFSAPSNSYLSPAYLPSEDSDNDNENDSFCWFGIIFYIPTTDEQKRRWISNEFQTYSRILDELSDKYGAIGHWAKVETHYLNKNDRLKLQKRIKKRFGQKLNEYMEIRNKYDPNCILVNDVVSDFLNI